MKFYLIANVIEGNNLVKICYLIHQDMEPPERTIFQSKDRSQYMA